MQMKAVIVMPSCNGADNVVVIFIPLTVVRVTLPLNRTLFRIAEQLRRPFGKLVDSPYYAKSELRGGAVTVSFSNKASSGTFQTTLAVAPS
jgi:hypothetical protein